MGRELFTTVGNNAQVLANAARVEGQLFRANIPTRLVSELEAIGLAERGQLIMNQAQGVQLRFGATASEFIAPFFEAVGR